MKNHFQGIVGILLVLVFVLNAAPSTAAPLTYTVNNSGDGSDTTPCTTGTGICTLRAAILAANAHAGPDNIDFDAAYTITPNSNLPVFSAEFGNTITLTATPGTVTLRGTSLPADSYGLQLVGDSHKVRGLIVQNFGTGIFISGNNNLIGGTINQKCVVVNNNIGIRIEGNYNMVAGNQVGVNWSFASAPNSVGIQLLGDNNTIGANGDGANDGMEYNLIGSSTSAGIYVFNSAINNTIAGNYIGAASDATVFANQHGIMIYAGPNRIGSNFDGVSDGFERNYISGNTGIGLYAPGGTGIANNLDIRGNSIGQYIASAPGLRNGQTGITLLSGNNHIIEGNIVSGNLSDGLFLRDISNSTIRSNSIGTDEDGVLAIGNTGAGIELFADSDNNTVAWNTIHHNSGQGILVKSFNTQTPTGNLLIGNSLYNNPGMGIDLESTSEPTLNDPGDGDTGPNNLQNFPEILSVPGYNISNPLLFEVDIQFNSAPSSQYTISFYRVSACHATGRGEGKTYLAQRVVTTPEAGDLIERIPLGYVHVPQNEYITALAHASDGSTSEFSPCGSQARSTDIPPANVKQVYLPALSRP